MTYNEKVNKLYESVADDEGLERFIDFLVERDNLIDAFHMAGVDNWEGYDYAMELYREGEVH